MAKVISASRRNSGEPSYTDLVYEVLREARQPLTFQEIFDAVERRRRSSLRWRGHARRGASHQTRVRRGPFGASSYGLETWGYAAQSGCSSWMASLMSSIWRGPLISRSMVSAPL